MELYILNRDLELKGIIDTFTSLRWIRRYYKSGEFELHCSLNKNTLQLLQRENIVYKKDDVEAGYIESRQLKTDSTGKGLITVKGKFLTNYIGRRINYDRVNFSGKTEELMRALIYNNAVNPNMESRKLPNCFLGKLKGYSEKIQYQNSFGNILECLENISNTSNLGFRNLLDIKNRKIVFDIYKGVDRTINNGAVAPCVFSRDFENILEQEYMDSINNYKNAALVAGAGESVDRKLTDIGNASGLDRYETYVDARDIEDKEQKEVEKTDSDGSKITETVDVQIPWEKYQLLLLQRGKEKLAEKTEVQTFDSRINVKGNNVYKKDFDLGDIVTNIDKKWKVKINARITEIEEAYEANGLNINISFGNHIPTLIDKIKQLK